MVSHVPIWFSLLQWNQHKAFDWPFQIFPRSHRTYLSQTSLLNATPNWPLVNLIYARFPAKQLPFIFLYLSNCLQLYLSNCLQSWKITVTNVWFLETQYGSSLTDREWKEGSRDGGRKRLTTQYLKNCSHFIRSPLSPPLFPSPSQAQSIILPGGPWRNVCLSRLTIRIKLLEQRTLAPLCWLRMIWLWASYLTSLSLNFLIYKFKINVCPIYFRGLFWRRTCDNIYKIALKTLTCPTKHQALS